MYLSIASLLNSFAYDAAKDEREKALFAGINVLLGAASTARAVTVTIHSMDLTKGHLHNVLNRSTSKSNQKAA